METEAIGTDKKGRQLQQGDRVRLEDGSFGTLGAVDRAGGTNRLWIIPDHEGSGIHVGNGLWAHGDELERIEGEGS